MPPVVTIPTRVAVGHGVGVHQVEGHGDDLTLEPGLRGADIPLQGVDMGVHLVGLAQERVVLLVAAVHRPRDLPGLPRAVFLVSHVLEFDQDLVVAATVLGESPFTG